MSFPLYELKLAKAFFARFIFPLLEQLGAVAQLHHEPLQLETCHLTSLAHALCNLDLLLDELQVFPELLVISTGTSVLVFLAALAHLRLDAREAPEAFLG